MKWYVVVLLIVLGLLVITGAGYSFAKIESNNMNYDTCDNYYDVGNCLLYQCKMNYSNSIQRSNAMYDLYHICMMNDASLGNDGGVKE